MNYKILYNNAARVAPTNGPKTGIQLYPQSGCLFFRGSKEYISLGPKSLAGLMANPVVPPRVIPITQTTIPTGRASKAPNPKLTTSPSISMFGSTIKKIAKT